MWDWDLDLLKTKPHLLKNAGNHFQTALSNEKVLPFLVLSVRAVSPSISMTVALHSSPSDTYLAILRGPLQS